MLEQQHDRVDQVLLVDLHDLHLLQQELGERDRDRIDPQPILPLHRVGELQPVQEDVDVQPRRRMCATIRDPSDSRVIPSSVNPLGEEVPLDRASLPTVAGEVDVRVDTVQGVLEIRVAGQRSANASAPSRRIMTPDRRGDRDQPLTLGLERRLIHGPRRLAIGRATITSTPADQIDAVLRRRAPYR